MAKRVARPKRTGNLLDDNRAEQEFNAMVFLVDHLAKNPSYVMPMHGHLLNLIRQESMTTHEDFFANATILSKLPEDWVVSFLAEKSALSLRDLARVKAADPEGLRRLFSFGLQLPTGARLPPAMAEKAVAAKALAARCVDVGNRFKNWNSKRLHADGSLNWLYGCYQLTFENNRATRITHCLGDTAELPDHVVVTPAFTLVDNHCDWSARVSLAGTEHKLYAYFSSDKGPHKIAQYSTKANPLMRHVATAEEQVAAAKAALGGPGGDEPQIFMEAIAEGTSERKQAAAGRARSALQARQESLKKSRRVCLSGTT